MSAISPFLTMYFTLYGSYFCILNALQNVVCNLFNLDQSEMLSSGNRLSENTLF